MLFSRGIPKTRVCRASATQTRSVLVGGRAGGVGEAFALAVVVPDLLGVGGGCGLIAVVMVHHLPCLGRHVGFREGVLRLVVMDEGDDVRQLVTGEVDLLAHGPLLGGNHSRGVVPQTGGEVEGIDQPHLPVRVHGRRVMAAHAVDGMAGDTPLAHEQGLAALGIHDGYHQPGSVGG